MFFVCVKNRSTTHSTKSPPTQKAARDVGEAALDQTEAELLDDEAKSLDANVAEHTGARETQEINRSQNGWLINGGFGLEGVKVWGEFFCWLNKVFFSKRN